MFNRRAVQMTFVKTPKDDSPTDPESLFDGPEKLAAYSAVTKDFIGYAALVVGGTYVVTKVVGGIVDAFANSNSK